MVFFKYVMPLLIGAIIGGFTNYLALKMMFHPYRPIRIGKWKLPFTPGVIPKRKQAIAKAVGDVIENDLVSREDLKKVLLSDEVKQTVIGGIMYILMDDDTSVESRLCEQLGQESYDTLFASLQEKVCLAAERGVGKIDVSALLSEKSVDAIEKYVSSAMPMVSLFLSREKLQSLVLGFGTYLTQYLSENAAELLHDPLGEKMHALVSRTPAELLSYCRLEQDLLTKLMEATYRKVVEEKADALLHQIHIGEIAQEKICQMDNRELENLTMTVMRRELKTLVYLGAALGALIGAVNIFF